jgi:hypothetical protein
MDMTYLKYPVYFLSGSLLITAITLIAEKKSQKVAVWNPIGAIADLVYLGFFAIGINIPGYTAAGLYSCMVWLLYPSYGIITGCGIYQL